VSAYRTPCGVTLRREGRAYRVVSPCCARPVRGRSCTACGMRLPTAGPLAEARRLPSVIALTAAAYGTTCPQPDRCADDAERALLAAAAGR